MTDPCAGIFATSRLTVAGGRVLILASRADPVVHISAQVLDIMAAPSEDRVLTELIPGPVAGDYTGAVLKIYCDDRTVIYRITGPCDHGCWKAQFPD